jgi:hypothetical protein
MTAPPFSTPETKEALVMVTRFIEGFLGDERLEEMAATIAAMPANMQEEVVEAAAYELRAVLDRAGCSAQILRGTRIALLIELRRRVDDIEGGRRRCSH